jgi:hypothetical protein
VLHIQLVYWAFTFPLKMLQCSPKHVLNTKKKITPYFYNTHDIFSNKKVYHVNFTLYKNLEFKEHTIPHLQLNNNVNFIFITW